MHALCWRLRNLLQAKNCSFVSNLVGWSHGRKEGFFAELLTESGRAKEVEAPFHLGEQNQSSVSFSWIPHLRYNCRRFRCWWCPSSYPCSLLLIPFIRVRTIYPGHHIMYKYTAVTLTKTFISAADSLKISSSCFCSCLGLFSTNWQEVETRSCSSEKRASTETT